MEVMGGEKATDLSNRVLRLKYEKTKIQFGESKHTRAAPVGRLLLATNKNIVKLIEGRSYA